jgi:hypothetical protein
MCPWCGGVATHQVAKTRWLRHPEHGITKEEGEWHLGWHCLNCDDYWGIDEEEDDKIL